MDDPQTPALPVTKDPWWKTKVVGVVMLVVFLVVVALVTSAMLASILRPKADSGMSSAMTPTPTVAQVRPTVSSTPLTSPTPASIAIKVYFSKHPESDSDFELVYGMDRTSANLGVAKAAMSALLSGATADEAKDGYFSEWKVSGPSTCGGDDFSVSVQSGKATVALCKDFSSSGTGQDARAQAEATATLTQFDNITSVIYLNKDGDCLFDESGQNACKE